MRLTTTPGPAEGTSAPWVIVGAFDDEPVAPGLPAGPLLAAMIAARDFSAKVGEVAPLYRRPEEGPSVLALGLGPRDGFGDGPAFRAGVAAAKELAKQPRPGVALALPAVDASRASAMVAGLVVGTVGPGLRKADPDRHPFGELIVVAPPDGSLDAESLQRAAERGMILGDAVNLARDLANTPPAEKTPAVLAEKARAIAEGLGLDAEVWDVARLRAERFGGVLAVASGSAEEPRFVHIRLRKAGDAPALALVGKGVTFDSGGLSLKPSASMEHMKCDMAGAAIVLATVQAAARLGLAVNVDAYFALTENMTGGAAMRLGDVLTMRNGLTVEVLNTDAEGRLILADVLSYAAEQAPSRMIDLATLTGACLVALGSKVAGLFANDDAIADEVASASKLTGERVWRMPLDDDYGDLIKSDVAEIKNVGGKWGGAITASKFLQRFVGSTPWAHLDIAGPAWADDGSATRDPGGTGCFVRTLVALLERQASA